MRRFNFNNMWRGNPGAPITPSQQAPQQTVQQQTAPVQQSPQPEPPKRHVSAYRTIISHHEDAAQRLKDEPVATLETPR